MGASLICGLTSSRCWCVQSSFHHAAWMCCLRTSREGTRGHSNRWTCNSKARAVHMRQGLASSQAPPGYQKQPYKPGLGNSTCSTHQSEVQPYKPLLHDCFAAPVLMAMLGFTRFRVILRFAVCRAVHVYGLAEGNTLYIGVQRLHAAL